MKSPENPSTPAPAPARGSQDSFHTVEVFADLYVRTGCWEHGSRQEEDSEEAMTG